MASVKNTAQISTEISDNVLSGGKRTYAVNVRSLLNDMAVSYVNVVDGGKVMQSHFGQSTYLAPNDDLYYTPKKYVDDLFATASGGGGLTSWSSTKQYSAGNTVLRAGWLYLATADNINEDPGSGSSWEPQIIGLATYGIAWDTSTRAAQEGYVYNEIEYVKSIIPSLSNYLDINGGNSMLADLDLDGNNLVNSLSVRSPVGSALELWTGGIKVMTAGYADFLTFDGISGVIFKKNGTEIMRFSNNGVYDGVLMSKDFINNSDGGRTADLFTRKLYNGADAEVLRWADNLLTTKDIDIDNSSAGLVLKSSADNHYYRYTAGIAGALTITDIGTSL